MRKESCRMAKPSAHEAFATSCSSHTYFRILSLHQGLRTPGSEFRGTCFRYVGNKGFTGWARFGHTLLMVRQSSDSSSELAQCSCRRYSKWAIISSIENIDQVRT